MIEVKTICVVLHTPFEIAAKVFKQDVAEMLYGILNESE
jgi:hypothetical protein